MYPRTQDRYSGVCLEQTQSAIEAIEDLAAVLDEACEEIERKTGYRSVELAEMAEAYRLVVRELENAPQDEYRLSTLCERIAQSAQMALVLIRAIARQGAVPTTQPPSIH